MNNINQIINFMLNEKSIYIYENGKINELMIISISKFGKMICQYIGRIKRIALDIEKDCDKWDFDKIDLIKRKVS